MIAAILVGSTPDDGSRATVDAENYPGFVRQISDQAIF